MFDEGHALRRNSRRSASRVDPVNSLFCSSSSLAKMLNNYDSSSGGRGRSAHRQNGHFQLRSSTSASSMKSRDHQRRSSSGSGLNGGSHVRFHSGDPATATPMGRRTTSSSSLGSNGSFDNKYEHLYSYSSNLDLFELQVYKAGQRRASLQPEKTTDQADFDLSAETKLMMDRTNLLVSGAKKSDREWVI